MFSSSNPGLCKCAYFIKKLYIDSRGACGSGRLARIFLFFFAVFEFFYFFSFSENDIFVGSGHELTFALGTINRFLAARTRG